MKKHILTFFLSFFLVQCASIKFVGKPTSNTSIAKISELNEKEKKQWYLLDSKKDSVPGMSVIKAKKELIKTRKSPSIIVAIIDSGIDIDHPLISSLIWENSNEIPNNKIDDDNNGYIDDVNGWNFLGDSVKENMEYVRLIKNTNPDDSLYTIYQNEINEEKEVAQQRIIQSKSLLQKLSTSDSTISASVGKKNYTLEEADKIDFKTIKLLDAISFIKKAALNGLNEKILSESIEYYQTRLDFHFNKMFNGRKIVGDDPENLNDKNYGNPNVIGPNKKDAKHGTHVAGIIANINKNIRIMPIRAVPDGDEYDKDIALAIIYAVDNGAKIINTSFGKNYSSHPDWVFSALKYAMEKDVLIINAAGNDSENIDLIINTTFPTDEINGEEFVNNVLTVGASSYNFNSDQAAYFSNYGSFNVDVFAPGYKIYSSVPFKKYDYLSGTSMAAPSTSGVASILRSFYPKLSALQIKNIIKNSGLPMHKSLYEPGTSNFISPQQISVSGKTVNLYNALLLASSKNQK